MSTEEYPEKRRQSLERKLKAYSAAAGASLLAAAGVQAQVIYTDIPDTTLALSPVYLNLDQDGPALPHPSAFDDLVLSLVPLAPGEAGLGKTGAIATNLYVGALSNSNVFGIRILGNYPTCNYGQAVLQYSCSVGPPANCYVSAQQSAARKGEGAPIGMIPVPMIPNASDQFIRIGGFINSLSTAAGKSDLVPSFEGWIRISVQSPSGSAGDAGPLLNITIKDHAIFVSPGGPISCDAASLPVEFVSFDARFNSGDLELSWVTASEINNAGFEVQYRQLDQGAFSPLGFVEGAGTTTTERLYTHTVVGLEPGKYVFRLKQIDLDGAFKFSDELEVTVEVPGTHFLSDAYPNPFNPQAHFSLVVPTEQTVRVELFDAVGRSMSVIFDGVVAADTPARFVIRGEDLPSGTYLYRATGETFTETKQLVLAK